MNVIVLCGLGDISLEGKISEELIILRNMISIMIKVISIDFVTIDYEKSDIDWFCDHGRI